MKISGNDRRTGSYYLGLDVGTESVGWAVTSCEYELLRHRGNAMWGVRLFDEAKGAAERRSYRTARRRAARRRQRLDLLELIFSEEIGRVDPLFFVRLKESALHLDDKAQVRSKYSIFDDDKLSDVIYHKKYPTVYHLRSELIHSDEPHDIRLVYLALHHIIKSRGHFLFDMDEGDEYKDIHVILGELRTLLADEYNTEIEFGEEYISALLRSDIGVTAKAKLVKEALVETSPDAAIDIAVMSEALAGKTIKFETLFKDPALKESEEKTLCLRGDIEEKYDSYAETLGERIEIVTAMKAVFDSARLAQILGGDKYISDAKVRQWNENSADLAGLKAYVRKYESEKYDSIFICKSERLNNYAAYSRYNHGSAEHTCSQEEFCKYLRKELESMKEHSEYSELWQKIQNNELLPKLRGADNGVIPKQLHLIELKKILDNASKYLGFLSETDSDGLSVTQKIIKLFDFRIPYYVGPLNKKSPNAWVIRTDEKITPWNFEHVVDTKASANEFMVRLTGKCTYIGEDVLPRDSLLYSEYAVLNEINPICVNGNPLPVDVKQRIFEDMFVASNSKVTKRRIKDYLIGHCLIQPSDEITGIDDTVKSKLKSYHDFKKILDKTHDIAMVEDVISHILIFGDDKKLLREWLRDNCNELDAKDIEYVSRLKYKDWGRLSRAFLTELYTPDEHGEALSVIDMMRATNCNLMQLMSDKYKFSEAAEAYRNNKFGTDETLEQRLDTLYVSPAVKRSIRQTLRIVDEITDIRKAAPEKIFIEMARGADESQKGKRTESRKDRLISLYKACKEDSGALYEALEAEPEGRLRHDALYLYYTQFGRCMYSGEEIDLSQIDKAYDVDHIYPQSKIKDDSLDNRVLVAKRLNMGKTNVYPVSAEIRSKMRPMWHMLKEKGMISEKKYERLVRSTPLSEDELASFVGRQLVETRQSTKALATVLGELYPDTRLVYSKAGNVSTFRQKYNIVKCRDVNDLHHAKDAYLNIVVGNVYCTKFTDAFFKNISRENYSLNRIFDYDIPGAWNASVDLGRVKNIVSKNNILVTRMAYEVKGEIAKRQISPKGKGQLPIKEGMDIAAYGGYDKIAGAYFFVVEHTGKKKRIRTVEPVYIYKKALYESDPVRYCTEILGLEDPIIVYPRILKDSLLELDGRKMYITGRSGNQLVGKHPYQLSLSMDAEQKIKRISKYIERCETAKRELEITTYDDITADGNIEIYDLFINKLSTPVYGGYFSDICRTCENGRDIFISLSLYQQCVQLLELLKLFKCDRTTANLTLIGGAKTSGVICPMKTVSNCNNAFLINQSVTGLFETRVDLLS